MVKKDRHAINEKRRKQRPNNRDDIKANNKKRLGEIIDEYVACLNREHCDWNKLTDIENNSILRKQWKTKQYNRKKRRGCCVCGKSELFKGEFGNQIDCGCYSCFPCSFSKMSLHKHIGPLYSCDEIEE